MVVVEGGRAGGVDLGSSSSSWAGLEGEGEKVVEEGRT